MRTLNKRVVQLAHSSPETSSLRLVSPTFPHFPRFREMVHPTTFELAEPIAETKRPQGLFAGLLSGHTEVLFEDATAHPEKYDASVVPLLTAILQGERKQGELTEQELHLLDKATLDFATYVPPAPTKKAPVAVVRKRLAVVEAEEEPPTPGIDVPVTDLPAYWWL